MSEYILRTSVGEDAFVFDNITSQTSSNDKNTQASKTVTGDKLRKTIKGATEVTELTIEFETFDRFIELKNFLEATIDAKQQIYLNIWGGIKTCYIDMKDWEWEASGEEERQNFKLILEEV